jgi:hypothetical protein
MPDDSPTPPPVSVPEPAPAPPRFGSVGGPTINIGEEFGTAKRNLPPAQILLIVMAALAVIAAIFAFVQRAKPQGQGTLEATSVAEIPGQGSVMVAATVTLQNPSKKPLWVHTIGATLVTADGKEFKDNAASAVDFERYFQALPTLREHATDALVPELKLMPGDQKRGTVVVSFPVTLDQFNSKKSFKVVIQPYDQPVPVELGQ